MKPPDRPSLRKRLLLLLVVGTGAVWIAIGIATFLETRSHTGRLFDAQLVEYSEVLSAIAGHEVYEIAGETTHLGHDYTQSCTYQVFSPDGALLMRSVQAPETPLAAAEGFSDVEAEGVRWRAFRRVDAQHYLVIIVAHQVREREALLRDIALRQLLPLLFGLPLLAVAIWLAVSRSMKPLNRLAAEVGGREAERLAPVSAADAPAEVEPLVSALNQLFARLERSFENERRFTGDAAHELRTPLAALRTQAEVALTTANDERRRNALVQVVAGVERATRLVEQLLALARIDAPPAAPRQAIDLAQAARAAIADLSAAAGARRVRVGFGPPAGDTLVEGDAVMLQALVRNLVDNAIRYSPEGGEVRVTVGRDGARVKLDVEDSGPGVPEELRGRIFDRFYRVSGSEEGGSGLGLSIARRVVELHGGEIAASESPALKGLRVTVSLPARGAKDSLSRGA